MTPKEKQKQYFRAAAHTSNVALNCNCNWHENAKIKRDDITTGILYKAVWSDTYCLMQFKCPHCNDENMFLKGNEVSLNDRFK